MSRNRVRTPFPVLTLQERDRRWEAVRAFMSRHGLDALVIFGWGRTAHDQYLTNEQQHAVVVMSMAGEPVAIVGDVPLQHYDGPGAAFERWLTDYRVGNTSEVLTKVLAERGVDAGAIGIVGMSSRMVGEWSGVIPHATWTAVVAALPKATFVDVADAFETMAMVKSDEEITMIRKAAAIGESACAAFVAAAEPSASERQVVAAAIGTIIAEGGWMAAPWILQRSGPDRFAWDRPEWLSMGGGSRTLRKRDTIGAEIFAFYGGYESQQQIDVCIGTPPRELLELEQICLESYQIGIDSLRPGIRFAELCELMHEPLHRAGVWNTGPLVQTISPVIYNGPTRVCPERDQRLKELPMLPVGVGLDGDFTVEKGTVFAFEPNAVRNGRRVCIGGTVIMGADRPEELNTIPNRLVVK